MPKQIVNEDQYLEICNHELKKDPDYKEGMKIIGVPRGSGSNLSGYSWEGPNAIMPALISRIVSTVGKQYELRATPR